MLVVLKDNSAHCSFCELAPSVCSSTPESDERAGAEKGAEQALVQRVDRGGEAYGTVVRRASGGTGGGGGVFSFVEVCSRFFLTVEARPRAHQSSPRAYYSYRTP